MPLTASSAMPLIRRLAAWRSRPRPGQGDALGQAMAELRELNSTTEEAFLSVGGRLAALQALARNVAAKTSSIAEAAGGDQSLCSVEALDEILARARPAMGEDAAGHQVDRIQASAEAILGSVADIISTVRVFDVLGVLIRIESARFSGSASEFVGLAGEVSGLSGQIRDQLAVTAESARALRRDTAAAAAEVRAVEQSQQASLGALAERVSTGFGLVRSQRQHSAQAAGELSGRYREASRAVGDVVVALQAHDITRQQIEHVVEAVEAAGGGRLPARTALLQAAQVDHARQTIERSRREIGASLGAIEESVGRMAGEAGRLLAGEGERSESFFEAMTADLKSVLEILARNRESERRLALIGQSVGPMLDRMAERTADVQSIGFHMQRIALNAEIQSVRLGSAGSALETIASAIQRLARSPGEVCEQIEQRLVEMRLAARRLAETEGEGLDREERMRTLGESVEALEGKQAQTAGELREAADLARRLSGELRQTIAEFGSDERASAILERAAETLRALAPKGEQLQAEAQVEIAAHYTMESEREIHEAVMSGAESGAASVPGAETEDNVEFF